LLHRHLYSFPTRRSSDLISSALDEPRLSSASETNPAMIPAPTNESSSVNIASQSESITSFEAVNSIPNSSYESDTTGDISDTEIDRKSTRLNSSHVSNSY